MAERRNFHVVPEQNVGAGGLVYHWALYEQGYIESRDASAYRTITKGECVAYARSLCHRLAEAGEHTELLVHDSKGMIKGRETYPRSSDPKRHKG